MDSRHVDGCDGGSLVDLGERSGRRLRRRERRDDHAVGRRRVVGAPERDHRGSQGRVGERAERRLRRRRRRHRSPWRRRVVVAHRDRNDRGAPQRLGERAGRRLRRRRHRRGSSTGVGAARRGGSRPSPSTRAASPSGASGGAAPTTSTPWAISAPSSPGMDRRGRRSRPEPGARTRFAPSGGAVRGTFGSWGTGAAEHWDGSAWTASSGGSPAVSVWGSGPDDVWTGYYGTEVSSLGRHIVVGFAAPHGQHDLGLLGNSCRRGLGRRMALGASVFR